MIPEASFAGSKAAVEEHELDIVGKEAAVKVETGEFDLEEPELLSGTHQIPEVVSWFLQDELEGSFAGRSVEGRYKHSKVG